MLADPLFDRLARALAGRYTLVRELGRGGMATVYLGTDVKLGRGVAIKLLAPATRAYLGSDRFQREVLLAAQLSHPHIVPLFEADEADGLLFYVMEYVEGESLRQRLSRLGPLPVEDAVRIAAEVGDALQYAHENGVIHRDVKPENILLSRGHALVSDFGIAKLMEERGSTEGPALTGAGIAVGTAAYMSPEQASGDKRIDPRSDVYSLAAVLYEMLAGEPPFTGPSAQAITARVINDPPRPIRTVRPGLPAHLERALEVRREARAHGADRSWRIVDHPCRDRLRAGSGKRWLAGEHLVQHRRQGVHVATRVDAFVAARLFRAHVGRGAHRDTGAGQRGSLRAAPLLHQLRDSEVAHQRMAAGQQDVLGFDIAVDHAVLVRVLQRVTDLRRDTHGVLDRERSETTEPLSQRLAFHVFHYIEQQPVRFIGLEQWHDMGMGELCGEQDFPLEPVTPEVGARGGRQQLDRHAAPELHVGAEIHRRHAAPAQLAYQGVATREGAGQAVEQRIGEHARCKWLPQCHLAQPAATSCSDQLRAATPPASVVCSRGCTIPSWQSRADRHAESRGSPRTTERALVDNDPRRGTLVRASQRGGADPPGSSRFRRCKWTARCRRARAYPPTTMSTRVRSLKRAPRSPCRYAR